MNSVEDALAQRKLLESWVPFLELACQEVFEIMLGSKLDPPDASVLPSFNVTAMVGLAGQLCGVLTLRCSSASANLMASRMLGVELEQADQHMWDALGEVCNMIAGNFKNKLTGMGDRCMLSVPTVVTGEDYTLHALTDGGPLERPFSFAGLPIMISLEIHS